MKKDKKILLVGIIVSVITILLTIIVKFVDVREYTACVEGMDCDIVETESEEKIGLGSINIPIHNVLPYNETLYKVTEFAGNLPVIVAGIYALLGLVQLIKRRSLKKVDQNFFVLAGLFVVAFILYVSFNKFAINYRPVLIDGKLESSFPSSHTMLSIAICLGVILFNSEEYLKNKYIKYVNIALVALTIFLTVGRILSGVHWFTDILCGLFYAASMILVYYAVLLKINNKQKKGK